MNIIKIDITEYIPQITESFIEVFGEEHKEIITNRINNTINIFYTNLQGIDAYKSFLLDCKENELLQFFFYGIGIDISQHRNSSFAESPNGYIQNLMDKYLVSWKPFSEYTYSYSIKNILSFDPDLQNKWVDKSNITNEQIQFINFLGHKDLDPITPNNFNSFKVTEEYNEITKKISQYLELYKKCMILYKNYECSLQEYDNIQEKFEIEKFSILDKYKTKLFNEIYQFIPDNFRQIWKDKRYIPKVQCASLFPESIDKKLNIEYFSSECEGKLKNFAVPDSEKNMIYYHRMMYFKNMGAHLPDFNQVTKSDYRKAIRNPDTRILIPPNYFVDLISLRRSYYYECAVEEYIHINSEFLKNAQKLDENFSDDAFYELLTRQREKSIGTSFIKNKPVIFYALSKENFGRLDYVYLKQLCKSIVVQNNISQDTLLAKSTSEENTSSSILEAIIEIFAESVRDNLRKKNIFIIEPQEHTIANIDDLCQNKSLKQAIASIVNKYKSKIANILITGKNNNLLNQINVGDVNNDIFVEKQ